MIEPINGQIICVPAVQPFNDATFFKAISCHHASLLIEGFFLDFSGKGEVRFRSFDLGTGRWIFAGISSCVQ